MNPRITTFTAVLLAHLLTATILPAPSARTATAAGLPHADPASVAIIAPASRVH